MIGGSGNVYEYVSSRPISAFDPTGLSPVQDWEPAWDGGNHSEGGGCAEPIVVTPDLSDQVAEEMERWGSGLRSRGNCYRFACNDPLDDGEMLPDHFDRLAEFEQRRERELFEHRHYRSPGGDIAPASVNCLDLLAGAIREWGVTVQSAIPDCNGNCPEGTTKVGLAVDPSRPDYHWWRQTDNGEWWHKGGNRPPTRREWAPGQDNTLPPAGPSLRIRRRPTAARIPSCAASGASLMGSIWIEYSDLTQTEGMTMDRLVLIHLLALLLLIGCESRRDTAVETKPSDTESKSVAGDRDVNGAGAASGALGIFYVRSGGDIRLRENKGTYLAYQILAHDADTVKYSAWLLAQGWIMPDPKHVAETLPELAAWLAGPDANLHGITVPAEVPFGMPPTWTRQNMRPLTLVECDLLKKLLDRPESSADARSGP